MKGYVKVYRKIMESSVWTDPHYLKLWMYCLMKATHKERKIMIGNQTITLDPGQFITGRKSLANDLNTGMKPKQQLNDLTWWRYLNSLEKSGMLNIKKTNKYSVVTVSNWLEYQETEHHLNNKRTSDEQQMNTNKNVKNVKNNNTRHKYDEDSIHYQLAKFFYQQILNNNPEHKEPNFQKWADDIRKMIELDNRTEEQIRYLMRWVQNDSFEMANVLSPSKLRKRFDQLVIKVKAQKQKVIPINKGRDVPKEFKLDLSAGEDW